MLRFGVYLLRGRGRRRGREHGRGCVIVVVVVFLYAGQVSLVGAFVC